MSEPEGRKTRKKRSPYVAIAWTCKRRKTKCSGEKPCKGCRESEIPCTYDRATRFQSTDYHSASVPTPISKITSKPAKQRRDSRVSSSPTSPEGHMRPSTSTMQSRYGSSDSNYFLRMAEKRLMNITPEHSGTSHLKRLGSEIGTRVMKRVMEDRQSDAPQGTFAALTLDQWAKILQIYQEEVGGQYPFIDLPRLQDVIRTSKSARNAQLSSEEMQQTEDMATLLVAVVANVVEPDTVPISSQLVETLFSNTIIRTQLGTANTTQLALITLASIYFFLSDREVVAWRAIGNVLRSLQELISLSSEDMPPSPSLDDIPNVGEKVFWSVYTLERRWAFGTGLPFAIHDSDIQRQPCFADDSLSSAYLKHMVEYCIISSEVRNSILQPSFATATPAITTRNFLDFQITQWQKNVPSALRFRGVQDKFDPSKENRGDYRLRLMLYLRGNQMRIVIHRKSALSFGMGNFDSSTSIILAETSRDNIRVLIALARETDIYHAQHKTFNHFLETALTSLLLIICSSATDSRTSYLSDVLAAMDLVRWLSLHSPIARALEQKLQGVKDIVKSFKTSSQPSPPMSPPGNPLGVTQKVNKNVFNTVSYGSDAVETSAFPNVATTLQNGGQDGTRVPTEVLDVGRSAYPGEMMPSQAPSTAVPSSADGLSNATFSTPGVRSQMTEVTASPLDFEAALPLDSIPMDFFSTQFPDLGDMLKDYESFRF